MKKLNLIVVALIAAVSSARDHVLWYDSAADDSLKGWEEQSLPIGCGHFGVNVFGTSWGERLQLTENSFLTHRNLTNALDVRFLFPGHSVWNARNYRRDLTLETGVATVSYAVDGVAFKREYFASYPARTLAIRFTASKKGALNFTLAPEIPFLRQFGRGKEAWVGREGRMRAEGNVLDVRQRLQWYNVRFFGRFHVLTDGKLTTLDHSLEVADATEATVFFSCGTNYKLSTDVFTSAEGEFSGETEKQLKDEDDPAEDVKKRVAAAAAKGWDALKAEHLADLGGLMRRVAVELPGADAAEDAAMPTDKLLEAYGKGRPSAYLEETYFQYGRYLLASSSRPGTLPANLQGVWTAHDKSPWGA
ncbi:MAG: glycoside hydrolase family 95 protein, partial [Kiritimatiellae bacterium]|nr:glycoside hydrolase family 95 protein [Kiritimatiellia bacterium]